MYIVYYKPTGEICYITGLESQVFTDDERDVIEVDPLPEGFGDITKKFIVDVQTKQLIEDPNFVYLTPEESALKQAKEGKFQEIKDAFAQRVINGHFYSHALGMEVDYRRGEHNNDLQNVESLISIMILSSTGRVVFKGYTEEKEVTLEQLQQLTIEMKQYGLWLYQRKWTIEEYVKQATKRSTVKAIPIDFDSTDYSVGDAFDLPEEEVTATKISPKL